MKNTRSHFYDFLTSGHSPQRLAASFCVGSYIAFSPFLMFHTLMVFVAAWFFKLHLPLVMSATYMINNPWTAIPIYMSGYLVGHWFLYSMLHIDALSYNPSWMAIVHDFFEKKLGFSRPCFWSFLLGGNVLGILTSLILYPVMVTIFTKLIGKISHESPRDA